eukprot:5683765-Pyramimonas_sp.AAC.2
MAGREDDRRVHGRWPRRHPRPLELPGSSSPVRAQAELLRGVGRRGVGQEAHPPDEGQVLHGL